VHAAAATAYWLPPSTTPLLLQTLPEFLSPVQTQLEVQSVCQPA
jgi:hypothetical protein